MKKKVRVKEVSEYRILYSTEDGQDTGYWETDSAEHALSCQIHALKNRASKKQLIISVESFNRFSNKWEDRTPKLFNKIREFNNEHV
jgi:hypothetical protein